MSVRMARGKPHRVFVVSDPTPVTPLAVPAAGTWLLDRPLAARSRLAFEEAGLEVEPVGSFEEAATRAADGGGVVTYDSVYASPRVVRGLLERFASGDEPAIPAALPDAQATRRLAHIDGLEAVTVDGKPAFTAPLIAVAPGGDARSATPALLPYQERKLSFSIPVGMFGEGDASFAATDGVLVRVGHWAHVLRLNLSAFLAGWIDRWHRPSGRLWYLWRALLGFPWRRGRLGEAIRRVHPKAKVHHRAVVELSVIEEGAYVGANAVIKSSWIGKGARIDDGAMVSASVVGAGAFVASGSGIFNCVLCPGAFAAQHKMQFSVLGENSVAFTGSYFYDLNFERNVRVPFRGKLADAGERFLSVCLGPWARVAGGVWIASGREVPAGALVVQPPDRVLSKIDEGLAGERRVTVDGGRSVDAGELPRIRPS